MDKLIKELLINDKINAIAFYNSQDRVHLACEIQVEIERNVFRHQTVKFRPEDNMLDAINKGLKELGL